jgi:hypothetical protein
MRALITRLLLAAVTAAPAVALLPTSPARIDCAGAAATHHAGVVVEHGNSSVLTRCVAFGGDSITGYDLLKASGIQSSTADYGGSLGEAVCQIDYEPPSYPQSCFSSGGSYWAIFAARQGGSWQLTSRGVSNMSFADGDVEGFRYDDQGGSLRPPDRSAAGACPPQPPPPSTPPQSAPPPPTPAQHPSSSTPGTPAGNTAAPAAPGAVAPPAGGTPPASDAEAPSTTPAAPPSSPGGAPVVDAIAASPVAPPSGNAGGWISASIAVAVMLSVLGWQVARRPRG